MSIQGFTQSGTSGFAITNFDVGGPSCTSNNALLNGTSVCDDVILIPVNSGTDVQFVNISVYNSYLTLCEVQVFAGKHYNNLAGKYLQFKHSKQSIPCCISPLTKFWHSLLWMIACLLFYFLKCNNYVYLVFYMFSCLPSTPKITLNYFPTPQRMAAEQTILLAK